MISMRRLTTAFGAHEVFRELDLDIAPGERVALLGLNGAGKTTLLRAMLGLVHFEGELRIAGHDVRTEGETVRAALGYMPQRVPHFEATLRELVVFFSRLRGMRLSEPARRLSELGLPLSEHGEKPVRVLSGGMLQKALLALALGADVPLLLLDEPTANLDPQARRELLHAIRTIDDRVTILLASHRLEDVEAVASRLLVLHEGTVAFDGGLAELWTSLDAGVTLWLRFAPHERDRAGQHLRRQHGLPALQRNGAALGVAVPRSDRADVLVELRHSGFAIEDFWTEAPTLQELLQRLLGSDHLRPSSGGEERQ